MSQGWVIVGYWHLILWLLLAWWIWMLWPVWFGLLQRRHLTKSRPLAADCTDAPLVSILVPARDEEQEIESALRGMLGLDYPNFEVIAIDDRSEDATGRIMDRLAAEDPRCRVIHIRELPAGWLGKNYANHMAGKQARGEYLLFTDGDVKFRPEALRHAMGHMLERKIDHLTLYPDGGRGAFWEQVLLAYFVLWFSILTRAALARFRWAKRAFVGVGAFNLVRREAYEAIGGHERLRLEVTDDMKLGKLLRLNGFRQDGVLGKPLVYVRWQTGVWGIIRGLEKNAFAGVSYSVPRMLLAVLAYLALGLAVPAMMITGPGHAFFAAVVITMTLTFLGIAFEAGYSPWIAPCWPVGSVLFAYLIWRSAYIALRDGGITWRGTFYPLTELRRGMV